MGITFITNNKMVDITSKEDTIYIWLEHHPTECWAVCKVLDNNKKN